jgi:hypothetical protein
MASAMEMANKLMERFCISDIDLYKSEMGCVSNFRFPIKGESKLHFIIKLCKLYDCTPIRSPLENGRGNEIIVFGFEPDLLLVEYFIKYVNDLAALKLQEYKYTPEYLRSSVSKKTLNTSFEVGFYNGVALKIASLIKEKAAPMTDERGLVLFDKTKMVNAEVANSIGKTSTSTIKDNAKNQDATQAGLVQGYNTNLSKPVNGGGNNKPILIS